MTQLYQIAWRQRITVNTDPQRRCYDGCNFSEREEWSGWATFGRYSKENGESSIATFQSINPRREFKLVPLPEELQ